MAYTTIDKPTDYFNTVLYSGNETARSITGVGFQPDWVWIKDRSQAYNHHLFDSVRGATKRLKSDVTDAESTNAQTLTAFGSDGFSLGTDNATNGNGSNVVSWNWLAGTSFSNDASATSVGTIDSSGSTNQTAGFSIVSWTGTGSAGTVAHNLGSVPEWYIIKNRSDANNWAIYHHKSNSNSEQYALYLDGTSAATDDSGLANDTAPTSTVFSLTNGNYGNQSSYNYIGYFFSEVKGYSKFGSYTGNGSTDGTFVYTGFKPAFVIRKVTSATSDWLMQDNKRSESGGFNQIRNYLFPNSNQAEVSNQDYFNIDFLSNGFKMRSTDGGANGSGQTYIYMAFAENPFVTSTGIPTTAR